MSVLTNFSNRSLPPFLNLKETASVSSLLVVLVELELVLLLSGSLRLEGGDRTVMADRSITDSPRNVTFSPITVLLT